MYLAPGPRLYFFSIMARTFQCSMSVSEGAAGIAAGQFFIRALETSRGGIEAYAAAQPRDQAGLSSISTARPGTALAAAFKIGGAATTGLDLPALRASLCWARRKQPSPVRAQFGKNSPHSAITRAARSTPTLLRTRAILFVSGPKSAFLLPGSIRKESSFRPKIIRVEGGVLALSPNSYPLTFFFPSGRRQRSFSCSERLSWVSPRFSARRAR